MPNFLNALKGDTHVRIAKWSERLIKSNIINGKINI